MPQTGGPDQALLERVVAGKHVESRDQPVAIFEGVAVFRTLNHVLGENVQFQAELFSRLVLPLLDAARMDGKVGIEVMRELNAVRFGHEPSHNAPSPSNGRVRPRWSMQRRASSSRHSVISAIPPAESR